MEKKKEMSVVNRFVNGIVMTSFEGLQHDIKMHPQYLIIQSEEQTKFPIFFLESFYLEGARRRIES